MLIVKPLNSIILRKNNFQIDYKIPIKLLSFNMDVLLKNIEQHDWKIA